MTRLLCRIGLHDRTVTRIESIRYGMLVTTRCCRKGCDWDETVSKW